MRRETEKITTSVILILFCFDDEMEKQFLRSN